jgi:hypothetical protein
MLGMSALQSTDTPTPTFSSDVVCATMADTNSKPFGSAVSNRWSDENQESCVRVAVRRRPVRVGVQLQPQHADYADLRRVVSAAEVAGVDVIFTWDRFFPLGPPVSILRSLWTGCSSVKSTMTSPRLGW